MNKKGFTLVELIAIILILAAILLVSFPSLLNMAKTDKDKEYEKVIEDLCLAGKSYIYANMNNFNGLSVVGSEFSIKIEELITYGNVDGSLTNPKTKDSIKDDELIYTVLDDYSLNCEYKDN